MELKGEQISLVELAAVALGGEAVHVSSIARPRILAARKLIEEIVARDVVIYGVNTGFGKLSDVRIPHAELHQLQLNLIRSHACGIGNPLSEARGGAMLGLRRTFLAPGRRAFLGEVVEWFSERLTRAGNPSLPE